MKLLFIIFSLFISTYTLHAQTYQVSGSVQGADKTPLEGCSVWFLQADTLAGGCVTDKKGRFELKGLPGGDYVCRVSMLGFKKSERTFGLSGDVKLPLFVLEEDSTQLDEVTVTGDKRDIVISNAGSTTYFLSEHARQSRTSYEALAEVPKLTVNPIQRTISLNNGESPLILIDGVKRPQYLEVLNPEWIESVEIVEVPSARYLGDESVTCILNIHLNRKKVTPYVNGNAYAQHSVTSKFGVIGASVEIGNAKSSLYLNLQTFYFADDVSDNYTESVSGDIKRTDTSKQVYNSNSYFAGLGGDHTFSDKSYLAFSARYVAHPSDVENNGQGYAEYLSDGRRSDLVENAQTDGTYHLASADLYYRHTFAPQHTLEIAGNYSYSASTSLGKRNEVNDFFLNNHLIDTDNSRNSGKLDVDYTKVFGGKYTLSAGSNTSYSSTHIDDRVDELPVFVYDRWQEYLYVGFDNNRSDFKFKYTFSLGMDMMFTKADGVKNHYIDVLPAVALTYNFSQVHALTLSYKRLRFSPSLSMLNPRNMSTDSLYIQQGNPFLRPSYQDRVRLSYRLSYKKLYLEPYVNYTYSSKLISAIGSVTDNIYTNTYKNFLDAHILTAGLSANYNLPFGNLSVGTSFAKRFQDGMVFTGGGGWNSYLSGYFYYKQLSLSLNGGYLSASFDRNSKSEGIPWSNATLSWNLPKGWQLGVIAESFICPKMKSKSWVVQDGYRSFRSSRMTDRSPRFLVRLAYSFKNKVEQKQRVKKRFFEQDNALEGIQVQ